MPGVVNYLLKKEVTQTQLNLSAGNADETSMQQYLSSDLTGVSFNDKKTI